MQVGEVIPEIPEKQKYDTGRDGEETWRHGAGGQ